MSTRGIRSMELVQHEADAGYCKVLSTDSLPLVVGKCGRVDMLASKKKRSSPSCQTENASAQSVICQRLFSPLRLHSNLRFSLVQVNLALSLFENRILRTPRPLKTEV